MSISTWAAWALRSGLVGERFLTPQSKLILVGLIAERLALAVALLAARLVHHEGEHAGEDKHRQCGDDDQNHCVGSHVGPLDLSSWLKDLFGGGAARLAPASRRQSRSDATAPTAIPKRNNVPVDPVG